MAHWDGAQARQRWPK